jgi:hypothetical protein
MNSFGQDLEEAIEDLGPRFGIYLLGEIHRALHVGKKDRDLFALAFERGAGSENLLGEVLRGVGPWIRGCGTVGRSPQRPAAAVAELLFCGIRLSAGRATQCAGQRSSAFTAEARINRIFEPAAYRIDGHSAGLRRDRRPGGQLHARDGDRTA